MTPLESARANLNHLFMDREVTVAIVKTWADTDFNKITSFGVPQ